MCQSKIPQVTKAMPIAPHQNIGFNILAKTMLVINKIIVIRKMIPE